MAPEGSKDAKGMAAKPPMSQTSGGEGAVPRSIAPAAPAAALPAAPAAAPVSPAPPTNARRRTTRRRILIGAAVVAVLALGFYATPAVVKMFNTISTDDAYVNGHVTFVAARVPGQVVSVLVDDNDRVRRGSLLVQLDKEPYEIQVALKRAAFETAQAQLAASQNEVHGLIAQARSNRYRLEHAIEDVDNQIALLRANVAALETRRATLTRAKADYDRAIEVSKTPGAISPQDVDQRRAAWLVAQAQVNQALEEVYQIRVGLGLPAKPKEGDDLRQVPPDLDQTYSKVREALNSLLQSAAALSVFPKTYNITPKELIAEFYRRDPEGNLDRIFAKIIEDSPVIKLAQAKLNEAKSELDQAELNLRYCNVVAEIDGVVSRRNVNRGNNVLAGEGLMALRSLTEIWVDANFKETQLNELRIGQRADLEVDMYGKRRVFKGRISGFSMGTGSTLALLPAQNATGNFIKVVQRLPVRIDLIDYVPDAEPLFVGLSVVPYVYYKEAAAGPDAGKKLRPVMTDLPLIGPDKIPAKSTAPGSQPASTRSPVGQSQGGQ